MSTSPTQHIRQAPISLRPATQQDLPRLASILIAAFPADPEWTYRFPHAAAFPDDHYNYTLRRVEDYFANVARGAADMMLAEADVGGGMSTGMATESSTVTPATTHAKTILGFAIWQIPGAHGTAQERPGGRMIFPASPSERRDADPAHVAAYMAVMSAQKAAMFNAVYGEEQAHLCLLGVDPDFQGLGAGTALVADGMDKARRGGHSLTLFGTGPGGRRLYTRMGFKEVGWCRVGPVPGEDEVLDFPGMVWKDG